MITGTKTVMYAENDHGPRSLTFSASDADGDEINGAGRN